MMIHQYGSMYLRYEGIEEEIVSSIDQILEFDWKALYVIVNVLSILGLSLKLKTIAIGIACLRFPPLCTWPLSIVLLLLPSYAFLFFSLVLSVLFSFLLWERDMVHSLMCIFMNQGAMACLLAMGEASFWSIGG